MVIQNHLSPSFLIFRLYPTPRFCANMTTVQEALVPHEEASEVQPGPVKSWGEDEPKNLESLLDTHIIENKIGGRVAGTSLYLTLAKKRDGTETGVIENQKYKLYLVSCLHCFSVSIGNNNSICVNQDH